MAYLSEKTLVDLDIRCLKYICKAAKTDLNNNLILEIIIKDLSAYHSRETSHNSSAR